MNTSESCAVVRPFSSSSAMKNLEMLKTLFNKNLELPNSCSEKSKKISSSFEIPNQCISKDIPVNNSEGP